MKIKIILSSILLGAILLIPNFVQAQAERDAKIVGSYQAVIQGRPITVPVNNIFTGEPSSYTFFVSGVLFSFNLNFNSLGFHEGRISRAYLFLGGRKIAMNGSVLVLPLDVVVGTGTNTVAIEGGRKNQNASFSLNPVTVPFVAGFNAEISFEGVLEYVGKQKSDTFFKEKVEYFSDQVIARADYDVLTKDLDLVTRNTTEVQGLIAEAKKTSNISGLFDTANSPKVYR